jgi:hypothetical protein
MMMGSWWQYSGYSSLPLLLDDKEIASMLDDVGPDGIPNAIAITRGIKDVDNTPAGDLIEQNLRGDRFVVGQGASASGRGEYWTGEPSSWSSWHAPSRGSEIAVLTRDSKIKPHQLLTHYSLVAAVVLETLYCMELCGHWLMRMELLILAAVSTRAMVLKERLVFQRTLFFQTPTPAYMT